jgi:hypothetical protein
MKHNHNTVGRSDTAQYVINAIRAAQPILDQRVGARGVRVIGLQELRCEYVANASSEEPAGEN